MLKSIKIIFLLFATITLLGTSFWIDLNTFKQSVQEKNAQSPNFSNLRKTTTEQKVIKSPFAKKEEPIVENPNIKVETKTTTDENKTTTTETTTTIQAQGEVENKDLVKIFKEDTLNKEVINLLNEDIKKELKEYEEYIKKSEADKLKMEEEQRKRAEKIKQQVEDIKNLINTNNWIYMWIVYIPKTTPIYYIKYQELVYLFPYYEYKIEYTEEINNTTKILSSKEQIIDKIKAKNNWSNIIELTEEEDFKKLKENFVLLTYDDFLRWIRVESEENSKTFELYMSFVVNQAIKELWYTYSVPDWTLVFFVENNLTPIDYKKDYENGTIKIYSFETNLLETWVSSLSRNAKSISSLKNFKELYIPIKMKKDQKLIVLKERNMWVKDVLLIVWNFVLLVSLVYYTIRKLLNIYKNI